LGLNDYPSGQILHAGFGQRWWNGADSCWGVNLFYDYQLKEHHQRLSVGAEMQHDCLKLALNGYLPLSGKRALNNSRTDAIRPAQGVDLQIGASLPQLPWLGLRSVVSYYNGSTGLLLKSQKFKEQHYPTVLLGLNVIPFPLFKISYDYEIGKQQLKEHRVALQLIYRFNRSLEEQLHSDQVRQVRSCQGSQLDLVSRRYQLVHRRYQMPNKGTPHQIGLNNTISPITRETPKNTTAIEQQKNRYRNLYHGFISQLSKDKDLISQCGAEDNYNYPEEFFKKLINTVDKVISNENEERIPEVLGELFESLNLSNEWQQFTRDR
jgi:hypothetical protein